MLLIMFMLPQAMAQTEVAIVIQAGSIQSMQPSQLYMDTDYVLNVKVLDENGNPVEGAVVQFTPASGLVTVTGSSSATTSADGTASLRLKFTAGGVVSLYVDDSRVKSLIIYYPSLPSGASAFILGTYIIIGLALVYAVYEGPYKSLRKV